MAIKYSDDAYEQGILRVLDLRWYGQWTSTDICLLLRNISGMPDARIKATDRACKRLALRGAIFSEDRNNGWYTLTVYSAL